MNIDERMKQEGFTEIGTGGGCVAYSRNVQVLITCTDGCSLPTSINDPVIVGLYDAETNDTISVQFYSSVVDFLKK